MSAGIERDLNDVIVFTRVVEAGTFTAAAHTLGLPKSTVSRRVSRLEGALGIQLLARTTRKLSLTDAGQRYYDCAARLLNELKETESALTEAQVVPKGRVRVVAPAEHSISSQLVARFLEVYPQVRVDIEFTSRQVNILEEGFDAAISAGAVDNLSVVAFKLIDSPFRIVASASYLERAGTPNSPQQLKDHACLAFGPPLPTTTWTLRDGDRSLRLQITPRATFNNLAAVHTSALAGHGIALLPTLVCGSDIDRGHLVAILPAASPAAIPVWLTYPAGRNRSRAARAFIDFVKANFASLIASA